MTTPDQPTFEHLPNFLNDAYIDLYKARALIILRCAKVLDGRPHLRPDVERLLHKLEERVTPERHPLLSPRPLAGGDTEEPDA